MTHTFRTSGASLSPATALLGAGRLNVNKHRPYLDKGGASFVIRTNADGSQIKVNANQPASLQYVEWQDIDRSVVEAATRRMTGWNDLEAAGLVRSLGSIGHTVSIWDAQSDMTGAHIDMSGATTGEKDKLSFRPSSVPVPIIHKEFSLNIRELEASRLIGGGVDALSAETAARRVAEAAETMLFQGADIQVAVPGLSDSARIYGYTSHPDVNHVDMSATWDTLDGSLGENAQIIEDVLAMVEASRAARFYGPFVLYVPPAYERKLDEDYRGPNSSDARTVYERLLALRDIQDVKVADFLPEHRVVLVP